MSDFLPFALPDIDDNEINEVVDSLRSGWLTTGPKTKRFEENFVEFLGVVLKLLLSIRQRPVCTLPLRRLVLSLVMR
jgi:dTDP-4-amino-4,6-dideoxygalactose transaminase